MLLLSFWTAAHAVGLSVGQGVGLEGLKAYSLCCSCTCSMTSTLCRHKEAAEAVSMQQGISDSMGGGVDG